MKYRKILSKRIKEQLTKHNMTRKELANITGLSEVVISRYISAQRTPTSTNLLKIAKAFNCSCDYLLGYDPTKKIIINRTLTIEYEIFPEDNMTALTVVDPETDTAIFTVNNEEADKIYEYLTQYE